jgi:hypothetical protein
VNCQPMWGLISGRVSSKKYYSLFQIRHYSCLMVWHLPMLLVGRGGPPLMLIRQQKLFIVMFSAPSWMLVSILVWPRRLKWHIVRMRIGLLQNPFMSYNLSMLPRGMTIAASTLWVDSGGHILLVCCALD